MLDSFHDKKLFFGIKLKLVLNFHFPIENIFPKYLL